MSLNNMADKVFETDVLVIGGGVGGCPLAVKAREHGLDVTLIEKAAVERSGGAAQGLDHFEGFFPRDGKTTLDLVREYDALLANLQGGHFDNPNIRYKIFDNSFWAVEELEKMGVTMKWDEKDYYFVPWGAIRGKIALRIHWTNVKHEMALALKKAGVKVLSRTAFVGLLTHNGSVVGATAFNVRTGEFIVVKCKAVVLAAGRCHRLYNPETPQPWKYKMVYHFVPGTISGDGVAAAYRAGAEIVKNENAGWTVRIRDDWTCSYGNLPANDGIPAKTYNGKGEEIPWIPVTQEIFAELEQKGLTPIYHTLEELPDDFHKRMEVAYADERPFAFKIAQDRRFNPRNHWYELATSRPLGSFGALYIDEDFKTSLKGLYAIGDIASSGHGGVSNAAISGLLLGDSISKFINGTSAPVVDEDQLAKQKEAAMAPLGIKDGANPIEFEVAIRHINERYVGTFKTEGKLREGMNRLGSLKREFLPKLSARNPHELMRCLELRSILQLAEVHMKACSHRKESRPGFQRLDYPDTDHSLDNKVLYQRLEGGKEIIGYREVPTLRPELGRIE